MSQGTSDTTNTNSSLGITKFLDDNLAEQGSLAAIMSTSRGPGTPSACVFFLLPRQPHCYQFRNATHYYLPTNCYPHHAAGNTHCHFEDASLGHSRLFSKCYGLELSIHISGTPLVYSGLVRISRNSVAYHRPVCHG